jgi:hypothetical protein
MYGVDVRNDLDLTAEEVVLAERINTVVEAFSRALHAAAGSHYQWEKAQQLAQAAGSLVKHLSNDATAEPGQSPYRAWPGIRPDHVRAAVAVLGQGHAAGRQLWPIADAPEIPEQVRGPLAAGYERNEQMKAALDAGDMDRFNRLSKQ